MALTACSPDPDPGVAASGTGAATATGTGSPTPVAAVSEEVTTIPQDMQGRWGLVPADCTSQRGDAKGLMIVYPEQLRFYESTARMTEVNRSGRNSVRGSFAYTGEGSAWHRDMILESQDNGHVLMRQEMNPGEHAEPLRYTRCG